MNIYFDLQLSNPGFFDLCSPEEEILLQTIWGGVYDAVFPLEQKLNKAEAETSEETGIIVSLVYNKILPNGYNKELSEEILSYLPEEKVNEILSTAEINLKKFMN